LGMANGSQDELMGRVVRNFFPGKGFSVGQKERVLVGFGPP